MGEDRIKIEVELDAAQVRAGARVVTGSVEGMATKVKAANLAVEKAQLAAAAATKKYGAESLEARRAAVSLEQAQQRAALAADKLAAAESRAATSTSAAGTSARRTSRDFSLLGASARRSYETVNLFGSALTRLGEGAAIGAGLGIAKFVKDGLVFQANMEQNRIAFTQFLGSAKAARKELTVLYQIAKTTPFTFSDVTLAARKFSAFGFSVKQSNELLRTLADTASGLALDGQGIDRMVLAIGQIKSKGVLMSQDLRQLQELGAIDMHQLAKDLGLTAAQVGDIGKQGVPAVAGLQAIERQWNRTFGGQSQKQAKTLNGQLSTLKDNYRQFAGSLTTGAFDFSKTLLGRLNSELTKINDEYRKNPKLTLSAKIEIAKEHLGPVIRDIGHELGKALGDAHVEQKFIEAMDKAIPVVAKHGAHLGEEAIKAFADSFVNGDPLTKLALGAFFLSRFVGWGNIFRKLGGKAADAFAADFAEMVAAEMSASVAADGAIGGALAGGAARGKWAAIGKVAGKAFAGAAATAIAIELAKNDKGTIFDKIADILAPLRPQGYSLKGDGSSSGGDLHLAGTQGAGNPAVVPPSAFSGSYQDAARRAAKRQGIDPKLFLRQIGVESGFDPFAKSGAGAIGIAQLMPGTARQLGVDPTDPINSLNAAAMLMAQYIKKYGNWRDALVAYNAGPGKVGGKLPAETQKYLKDILGSGTGGGAAKPIKWSPVSGAGGKDAPGALAWAQQMVGHFKESTGKNTGPELDKLQREFSTHAAAWCAEFVTAALVKGGFPRDIKTPRVKDLNEWAKAGVRGLSFTTSPQPGDLMTFGDDHVAIVEKVDRRHGVVHVIDGNNSKGMVARGTRGIGSGRYISADPAAAGGAPTRHSLNKTPTFRAPSIKQDDVLAYLQAQLDHLDLLAEVGDVSKMVADVEKRAQINAQLPYLKGDARLKARIMLKQIPKLPKALSPAQMTWSPENLRNLAVSFGNKNPSYVPPGGWAQFGQDHTLENPFLKAALAHTDLQVGAGDLTADQGNRSQLERLKGALPFLAGDEALKARAAINELTKAIDDNTKAQAENSSALAQGAGGLGGSVVSLLGQPGGRGLLASLVAQGVDQIPGGLSLSSLLSSGDAGMSMVDFLKNTVLPSEISQFGSPGLTDPERQGIWGEILGTLGDISNYTNQTADNTAEQADLYKAMWEEAARGKALSEAGYGVFSQFLGGLQPTPYLGSFDHGTPPRSVLKDGLAHVHQGETIAASPNGPYASRIPTAGGAPHVSIVIQASPTGVVEIVDARIDGRAAQVADTQMGRDMRQLVFAPGG